MPQEVGYRAVKAAEAQKKTVSRASERVGLGKSYRAEIWNFNCLINYSCFIGDNCDQIWQLVGGTEGRPDAEVEWGGVHQVGHWGSRLV